LRSQTLLKCRKHLIFLEIGHYALDFGAAQQSPQFLMPVGSDVERAVGLLDQRYNSSLSRALLEGDPSFSAEGQQA